MFLNWSDIFNLTLNIALILSGVVFSVLFLIFNFKNRKNNLPFYISSPIISLIMTGGIIGELVFSYSSIYGSWWFINYLEFSCGIILLLTILLSLLFNNKAFNK